MPSSLATQFEMQDSAGGQQPRDGGRRDFVDMLRDLAVLRDRDVLTEAEFQRAKVKLLTEYQDAERSDDVPD